MGGSIPTRQPPQVSLARTMALNAQALELLRTELWRVRVTGAAGPRLDPARDRICRAVLATGSRATGRGSLVVLVDLALLRDPGTGRHLPGARLDRRRSEAAGGCPDPAVKPLLRAPGSP